MKHNRRLFKAFLSFSLASLVALAACDDDDVTGPEAEDETQEVVTTSGGQVALGGGSQQGGVTIRVPQGATSSTVTITLTTSATSSQVSDQAQVGLVYELGPSGTQFSTPVEVKLPYPSGYSGDASALLIFTTSAAGTPELLSSYGVVEGQSVFGQTTHFSPFYVSASGHDPVSLSVSPTAITLTSGATLPLSPDARNVGGARIPPSKYTVTYSSSDSDIASVNSAGTVTAGKVGTATITASSGGRSATVAVTVITGALAGLVVTPGTAEIKAGGTQAFTAAGTDGAGNDLGQLAGVSWASSNTDVAVTTGSGGTAGLTPGTATITASLLGVTGSAVLTVKPAEDVVLPPGVDSVLTVSPAAETLRSGSTAKLTATTVRSDGTASASTGVTWSSRDGAVASVSADGVVTAAKVGVTHVVGSAAFGSDSTMITVTAGAAAKVTISPDSVEVPTGVEETLSATAVDASGNATTDVLGWTSSDPGVATVNPGGVVRGVSVGITSVTVSTNIGVSATAKVVVASGLPVDFGFDPDPASVRAGEAVDVTVLPQDKRGRTTVLPDTMPLMVEIRDTSIAKVSLTKLVATVTGHKVGSTWLIATAETVVDSVMITTTPGVAVSSTFLSPSQDTTVTAGDTVQVTMQGTDGLGNVFTQTGFALASGDGTILEIQAGLKIMGMKVGTTALSATVDALTKSINVTVAVGAATSVTITDPSADTTMTSGGSVTLAAVVADRFGNPRGDAVAFTTSDAAVIGLSGAEATAAKVGTGKVTATSGTLTDTRDFTVVHGAAATIAFLDAHGAAITTASVGQLDTLQTISKATDAAGNEFTDGIVYASADEAIAAVNAAGEVIGVALGTVNITASRDGQTATLAVTVKMGTLKTVTITPTADTASAINQVLEYLAAPKDRAENVVDGVTFTWTIRDTNVATVTVTPVLGTADVTAVGNGTTILHILASKEGNNVEDSATVVVDVKANTVTIVPDTATLEALNATVDLSGRVTAKDANGNTILNPAVSWTSTDIAVATVSGAGVVTAVAGGPPVGIIAMVDAVSDTATVTVDIKADSIVISPVADTTAVDGNVQFTAMTFSGGQAITATVAWTSTVAGTATVDNTGKATGVAAGVTKIVATSGTVADTASLGVADGNSIISTAFPNAQALATATEGDTVTVAVTFDMGRVDATGNVGSVQFDLDYDATVFEAASGTTGVAGNPNLNLGIDGKVKFGFIATSAQGSSNLTLATIKFVVKAGAAKGRSAFTLTYTAVPTDTNFGALPAPVAVAGEVQIN
jgi:uncharacterized protein YjdB